MVIDTSGVSRFDRKPTKYNIMMYIYTIMDTSGVYRFNRQPKKNNIKRNTTYKSNGITQGYAISICSSGTMIPGYGMYMYIYTHIPIYKK